MYAIYYLLEFDGLLYKFMEGIPFSLLFMTYECNLSASIHYKHN